MVERLNVIERSDPVITKRIIETGQISVRDPLQICELVVGEFDKPPAVTRNR